MLLSNPAAPDPRVERETRTLSRNGFDVMVCAWGRGLGHPKSEKFASGRIVRFGPKSGFGIGFKQVYKLPRFWMKAFFFAIRRRYDMLHCNDLDMMPVALALKAIGAAPRLVFDVHELYPLLHSHKAPRLMIAARIFEWFAMRLLDRLIMASEKTAAYYKRFGRDACVLPNEPDIPDPLPEPVSLQSLGLPSARPLVAYIGVMSDFVAIPELIEATRRVGAALILGGGEKDQFAIAAEAARRYDDVYFTYGRIPYVEAISMYRSADIIAYCIRRSSTKTMTSVASNNVRLAAALGRPVLTTRTHGDAEYVEREGFGVVVDEPDVEHITEGLQRMLSDPDGMRRMAENSAKVGKRHTWSAIEGRLVGLYEDLIVNKRAVNGRKRRGF